jgi:hypothetical protein
LNPALFLIFRAEKNIEKLDWSSSGRDHWGCGAVGFQFSKLRLELRSDQEGLEGSILDWMLGLDGINSK